MSDEFIKRAIEVAALNYVSLQLKRDDIARQLAEVDREIAKLSLKIVSLGALCDDIPKTVAVSETFKEVSKIGLTDAVRSVLRANGGWMEPTEIRDQVLKLGVSLDKYKNPLASIHTILDRLWPKEVDGVLRDEKSKKVVYRWKGPEETVWERLQKLPREKADEVVTRTAETLVKEGMKKVISRSRKAYKASKKKE